MEKIEKGDLVEVKHAVSNCAREDEVLSRLAGHYVSAVPTHLVKGIVIGTEKDCWVIKEHIDVKNFIIPVSDVKRIIQKQAIPKRMFRYLEGSLYKEEKT